MRCRTKPALLTLLLLSLCWGQAAQASNRWDVLRWCTTATPEDVARCEGFLNAALDLRTSDDFAGSRSCFLPGTRLPQVRQAVVEWLKGNRVAAQHSGLALVARAIEQQFPCPE